MVAIGGRAAKALAMAAVVALGACSFTVDTSDLSGGTPARDAGDGGALDSTIFDSTISDSSTGDANDSGIAVDSSIDADDATGVDSTIVDTSNDTPKVGCKGTAGPASVPIDGKFCIDSTEVTNAQYADFLAAKVSTTTQPLECLWNTTYVPGASWPPAAGRDAYPVGNVNWCDARAYCLWAGKRLCGKVGGGAMTYSQITSGEMYYACSADGTLAYPYGNTYDAAKCGISGSIQAVATYACQGGYPGVFDLGGNVAEWQDACDGTSGSGDNCREGTWPSGQSDPSLSRCDAINDDARNHFEDAVGFRCCSDVSP